VLEVTQQHDLPIALLEPLDRRREATLQFVPGGRRSRRQVAVGHLAGRSRQGVVAPERHLPVEAARGRDAVPAVGVDEPVAGHVPQPELEGHRRVGEVVAEPAIGLDEHVLHDVAGVDPPLHHPIHPPVDHPPDRIAMPRQKVVDRRRVPATDAVEQHERLLGFHGHGGWVDGAGHADSEGVGRHLPIVPTCRPCGPCRP
jgi:hypothetical protein